MQKGGYSAHAGYCFNMTDPVSRFTPFSGSYPHTYFAGANTADGFLSAYPDFIREEELAALFIIKGGSGTGKSSLMKACAAHAASRGASVTLLLCSSDPSSADAVLLTGKNGVRAALLDGTPPHSVDPLLPGAVGEIVNVGDYWDGARLAARREEIAFLTAAKRAAYARANRFLAAGQQLNQERRALLAPCILHDKLNASVRRLLASCKREQHPAEHIRHVYALSMTGAYHLTTLSRRAGQHVTVLDRYGTAEIWLNALRAEARRLAIPAEIEAAPVCPRDAWGVFLPGAGLFAALAPAGNTESSGKTVNMQRFLDRSALAGCRARLRFAARCRDMLLDGALDALREAGKAHFALEELYRDAMDFDGVSQETRRICARLDALW